VKDFIKDLKAMKLFLFAAIRLMGVQRGFNIICVTTFFICYQGMNCRLRNCWMSAVLGVGIFGVLYRIWTYFPIV